MNVRGTGAPVRRDVPPVLFPARQDLREHRDAVRVLALERRVAKGVPQRLDVHELPDVGLYERRRRRERLVALEVDRVRKVRDLGQARARAVPRPLVFPEIGVRGRRVGEFHVGPVLMQGREPELALNQVGVKGFARAIAGRRAPRELGPQAMQRQVRPPIRLGDATARVHVLFATTKGRLPTLRQNVHVKGARRVDRQGRDARIVDSDAMRVVNANARGDDGEDSDRHGHGAYKRWRRRHDDESRRRLRPRAEKAKCSHGNA